MKKLIVFFLCLFAVQMEAGDRDITCTTRGPKNKDPLPTEKSLLLINEAGSALAKKGNLKKKYISRHELANNTNI